MKPNQHAVQVAIEVPSGKLVFQDSFTDLFNPITNNRYWCDGMAKEKERIKEYAKQGLLRGFIGNSCPGIFRQGDTLVIGNHGEGKKRKIPGQDVGGIVTDTCTYCAVDLDLFLSRGGQLKPSIHPHQNPLVIEVTPGRYILSHFCSFNQKDFPPHEDAFSESGQPKIFATITKSDAPVVELYLPEEDLEDKLNRLVPEATWHRISVLKEYERFVLEFEYKLGDAKAQIEVEFSAEQIRDDAYLSEQVRKAKEKYEREEKFMQDCMKKGNYSDEQFAEIRRIMESRCSKKYRNN